MHTCFEISWLGFKHWKFDFRYPESQILAFDPGWTCQPPTQWLDYWNGKFHPQLMHHFSQRLNRHGFDPSHLSVLGLCLVFIPILKSVCTHCALSHTAHRRANGFFLLFFLLTTKRVNIYLRKKTQLERNFWLFANEEKNLQTQYINPVS